MSIERTLGDFLRRLIHEETIWLRHYIGQVISVEDPERKGKIHVKIYDLMTNPSDDFGFWCVPRDKNALSTPKINDWVEVYFMNGNENLPVYMGIANEMKQMLPVAYDGKATTHVLFESPDNKIHVKYDEAANTLEIGNSAFKAAARKDDATISTSAEDSAFWAFWSAMFGVVKGAPINEPGSGAPSAFQAALKAALTASTPAQLVGKINAGSDQVTIGNK